MIKLKNLTGVLVLSSILLVGCQSNGSGEEGTEVDSTASEMTSDNEEREGSTDMEEPVEPLDEVSDEDLEKFSRAVIAVQAYGQEVQPRMLMVVQESGLDPMRYSQIAQAQQMPGGDTMKISPDEAAKFKVANAKVEALREGATDTMEIKIREAGLTVEHYRAIIATIRMDPELQQKVSEIQKRQMAAETETESGS